MRLILALCAVMFSMSAQANYTMPIICSNEERVERILCPVSPDNEKVRKCECPEGMNPVVFPETVGPKNASPG